MQIDLSGKTALVTGGSRGIGRAICTGLAESGARVIVNFRSSAEEAEGLCREIELAGGEAVCRQGDVSDADEVEALFQFVESEFEQLDILVNNAGVIKDTLLLSMKLSDWDKVMDTNLRSAFLCSRLGAEMMFRRRSGKIINMSSVSAIRSSRGQANYAASKGGILSFTRACAAELAGRGIQVNAVLPGFVETDMTRRVMSRAGKQTLERIPSGRFGQPDDIAGLVVFLASPLADYITGQAIPVDGGLSI
ncbi:MAG: 3-oxoacyl-ACP reductase FabG [Gammaproteobacteria bacterium]|nr:3-oxoacyl-ACP reductase FabG [Gammaproteobacteria bacterium]